MNLTSYNKGLESYNKKNFEDAVIHFSNAIKENSLAKVPAFHNIRAMAYYYLNNFKNSLEDFNLVLEKTDDKPEAFYYRGLIHFKNNSRDLAIKDFESYIRLDSKKVSVYQYLFFLYIKDESDYEKALKAINKVIDLDMQPGHFYEKARLLKILNFEKNLEEIILCCNKTIELAPNWFLGYHALALTHYENKNFSNAIIYFTKAIKLQMDEEFYYYRGLCYKEIGNIEKYIEDVKKSIELGSEEAEKELENNKFLFTSKEYILFFDTETTGVPKNWNAPVSNIENWPRLIQIAWQLYDEDGKLIESYDSIIKPDNFVIPIEATKIHGITTEKAYKEGKDLELILENFKSKLNISKLLVAHNISFDEKILGAEFYRLFNSNPLEKIPNFCTMKHSTNICKLEGSYGYKWPKLEELYYFLFKTRFNNAHDAKVDIQATAECYFEMKKRNYIK